MSVEMVRVRRTAVRLAVLPCAAALLAACQSMSIDSGPPNFTPAKAATTLSPPKSSSIPSTAPATTPPTGTSSGATPTTASVTATTAPPAAAIPGTATGLAAYLQKHYADAPWYGDVNRVNKATGGQTVVTTLQPNPTQKAGPAKGICQAVRAYQTTQGGPALVTIDAQGGIQLKRVTKTESC